MEVVYHGFKVRARWAELGSLISLLPDVLNSTLCKLQYEKGKRNYFPEDIRNIEER